MGRFASLVILLVGGVVGCAGGAAAREPLSRTDAPTRPQAPESRTPPASQAIAYARADRNCDGVTFVRWIDYRTIELAACGGAAHAVYEWRSGWIDISDTLVRDVVHAVSYASRTLRCDSVVFRRELDSPTVELIGCQGETRAYAWSDRWTEVAFDGEAPPGSAGASGDPGRVQVCGYHRRDGTYVRPHTRARPR